MKYYSGMFAEYLSTPAIISSLGPNCFQAENLNGWNSESSESGEKGGWSNNSQFKSHNCSIAIALL